MNSQTTLRFKKPLSKSALFFLTYTTLFFLLSAVVFSSFWLNGKSMIWKPDGLTQHFNAFVYFGNWGRQIHRTLLTEHRLEIPLWDFSIGYGSDVLTTLQYYVVGDPFSLVSIFTPVRFMEGMYNFLILLRLYLTGITFSLYCRYIKCSYAATLAGALSYTFCGYLIVLVPQHPSFITPLIYLPLLLLGAEKVFQDEKGHLLILATALSAITNFYFFYMLVVLTVLYCIIRFSNMKHQNLRKDFLRITGRILFFSMIGTAASAVLLIPVVVQFLSDSRSDTTLTNPILYPLEFYAQFPDALISMEYSSYWTHLGFTGIALLALFVLFLKRGKYTGLKVGFALLTLMLLLPAAGSLMNGFSYSVNRWCFGYSFLVALIVACVWQDLFTLSSREKHRIIILTFLYTLLLVFLPDTGSSNAFFSLGLLLCALFFLMEISGFLAGFTKLTEHTRKKLPSLGLILLLILGILGNSVTFYRIKPEDHIGRFVDYGQGLSVIQETGAGMMSAFYQDGASFSRYAQDPMPIRNDSIHHNAYSIDYYWSLSNGAVNRYFDELALPIQDRAFKYNKLDYRAHLHALAGVQYYLTHNGTDYIPYPYSDTRLHEFHDTLYYVSETSDFLPLGFTYEHIISRETYEALPYLQRQQALLQGAVCETTYTSLAEAPLHFDEQSIPFTISHDSNIIQVDNTYYALEGDAKLTLSFEGIPGCETYFLIEGLQAHSMTDVDFIEDEEVGFLFLEDWNALSAYEKRIKKTEDAYDYLNLGAPTFLFSCTSDILSTQFAYHTQLTESAFDRTDYLVNMGYSHTAQETIILSLPYAGCYSFENLEILCLPIQNLPKQLETLQTSVLENITMASNLVSGTIAVDEPKLLCLSIPYSAGWSAYVDGDQVPLLQVNTMFMGIELDAGEHLVELRYETPGLPAGRILSIGGLFLWFLYLLYSRKKPSLSE